MDINYIKNKIIESLQKDAILVNKKINTNTYSKNKFKARLTLNGYLLKLSEISENIDIINRIFREGYNYYVKKYPRLIIIIMETNLTLIEKIEAICYLINVNYNFFTDEKNILTYARVFNEEDINTRTINKFNSQKRIYLNLRNIIREDNTVGEIKAVEDSIQKDFIEIGIPIEVINLLMDMAMRNYENSEHVLKR